MEKRSKRFKQINIEKLQQLRNERGWSQEELALTVRIRYKNYPAFRKGT